MSKEVLIETDIPREKGFLYFTGTTKDGNITLCRTKMARGRKKKNGKKD